MDDASSDQRQEGPGEISWVKKNSKDWKIFQVVGTARAKRKRWKGRAGLHERTVRSDVWWGIAGEPGLCIWRRVGSICRWTQRQRAVKSPVQQLHGVLCNEH